VIEAHRVEAIDVVDEGFVVRCACGWHGTYVDRDSLVDGVNEHRATSRRRRKEPLRAAPAPPGETVDVRDSVDLREEADGDPPRVLVVDDEPDIRAWLRITFRERGWMVNTAGTAEEGLEMARRLRPALVLLDQRLPDAPGLSIGRTLREEHPEMTVVMFSASLDLLEEEEAATLGMVTISKVDRTALLSLADTRRDAHQRGAGS
jgi:CheY-like chemotaxis protein